MTDDERQQEIARQWQAMDTRRQRYYLTQMDSDQRKQLAESLRRIPKPSVSPTLAASRRQASKSEFEKNVPESTWRTRAREAAISVLEPFTASALASTAGTLGRTAYDISTRPADPKSLGELRDLAVGIAKTPIQPLVNLEEGFRTGDYDRMAYGAGGFLSQTVPAVAGIVDPAMELAGREPISVGPSFERPVGYLRDKATQIAQRATGASAFKTTKPLIESSVKEIEKAKGATQAERQRVSSELETQRDVVQRNARASSLEESVNRGSAELGQRVVDLDKKLRAEGDAKYELVREQVGNDPGIPLEDMLHQVDLAKSKLAGSAESIKQFQDLIKKGETYAKRLEMPTEEEVPGTLSFADVQGYSSELGRSLEKGNLPGDVYQAISYLKEQMDMAKRTIAERNGAGALLADADHFWSKYRDLYSRGAIGEVFENVTEKQLDTKYHADPFTKGKAGDAAVAKLKQLQGPNADSANAVADLARNLQSAHAQLQTTSTGTVKPVSPPTRTVAEPVTGADIMAAKRKGVESTSERLGALTKFDLPVLAGSVVGVLTGHWLAGLGLEGLRVAVPEVLTSEQVLRFMEKPTAADLELVKKLPEPAQAKLRSQLNRVLEQAKTEQRAAAVDPRLQRLIGIQGNITNRQDALDVLQQQRISPYMPGWKE